MTREGIQAIDLLVLSQPTPREEIKQRQGNRQHDGNCDKVGGNCRLPHRMLDYVDARFVMERLDEIGAQNWQDRYKDRTNGSVRCGIGVLVEGEWIWKWDVGDESDIEADKGAHSGAFKRAGVKWGIARDLYGHTTSAKGREGLSSPGSRPAAASAPRQPVLSVPAGGGSPEEPDYLRDAPPMIPGATQQARDEAATRDGFCPAHGFAWTNGSYGWYCKSKAAEGYKSNPKGYCAEKPSAKWVALQEVAS